MMDHNTPFSQRGKDRLINPRLNLLPKSGSCTPYVKERRDLLGFQLLQDLFDPVRLGYQHFLKFPP
jgi:hypothetical protein